jgi:hypothetical protein
MTVPPLLRAVGLSPFQLNVTDVVSFFFAPRISPFNGEVNDVSLSLLRRRLKCIQLVGPIINMFPCTYQLEFFCIIAVLIQVTSEPANACLLVTTTK